MVESRAADPSNTSYCGTLRYMAPEVAFRAYSFPADVFSFGVCIYELLHEERFLAEEHSALDILLAVLHDERPPARLGTVQLAALQRSDGDMGVLFAGAAADRKASPASLKAGHKRDAASRYLRVIRILAAERPENLRKVAAVLGIGRLVSVSDKGKERLQLRLYDSTAPHVRRQLAPLIALCLAVPAAATLVADERARRHLLIWQCHAENLKDRGQFGCILSCHAFQELQ